MPRTFWAKLTKTDLPGEPHFPQRTIYYFTVHLRIHPRPSFVVNVTSTIEGKMRALSCYHSQFVEGRPSTSPTLLDDLRPGTILGMVHWQRLWRTFRLPRRNWVARFPQTWSEGKGKAKRGKRGETRKRA